MPIVKDKTQSSTVRTRGAIPRIQWLQ